METGPPTKPGMVVPPPSVLVVKQPWMKTENEGHSLQEKFNSMKLGSSWSTKGSDSMIFWGIFDLSDDGILSLVWEQGNNQRGYAKIYDWSGGSWSQYDQTITGQSPRRQDGQ